MNWTDFDYGSQIGKLGTENGVIIVDQDFAGEARITLEKNGSIAPFSISLGIYGLMFHTIFSSTLIEANESLNLAKGMIERILHACHQTDGMNDEILEMINELASM